MFKRDFLSIDRILDEINKDYIKKFNKELKSNGVNVLDSMLNHLCTFFSKDNEYLVTKHYIKLFRNILESYTLYKQKKVDDTVSVMDTSDRECVILYEFVKAIKNSLNDELLYAIFNKTFGCLVISNIHIAKEHGCVSVEKGVFRYNCDNKIYSINIKWFDLLTLLYESVNQDVKRKILQDLYNYSLSDRLFKQFRDLCICSIIYEYVDKVIDREISEETFKVYFEDILRNSEINDIYAEYLTQKMRTGRSVDFQELLKLLNKENAIFFLTFTFFFYIIPINTLY